MGTRARIVPATVSDINVAATVIAIRCCIEAPQSDSTAYLLRALLLRRRLVREKCLNQAEVDLAEISANREKGRLLVARHVHDDGVEASQRITQ